MVMIGLAATAVLALLLSACDDEPTQEEAEDQFCSDVGDFLAALGELRDVDSDTPIDELEDANDELRATIDDISDDATLGEALDQIDTAVEDFSVELSQVLNDVNCGSGQGGQETSDE
jgi:hypothetical protein